jgi:hypothetical protein
LKTRQPLLALIFVCLACVGARADGILPDGRIIVGHGSDPAPPASCGTTFKIHLNGNGGGIKNCVNTSGLDWIGLDIFAIIPLGDSVNCIKPNSGTPDASVAVFSSCSKKILSTFDHKERIEIFLSGGLITSGSLFFLNLNGSGSDDPNASGGWFAFEGGNLDAQAVTAPEPWTGMLVACGLGLFAFVRRLRPN